MNIAKYFTARPIFASVLSIIITLLGLLALRGLPVSEYPEVVPPSIAVRASYPGASPETIATTVAGPLEQQFAGIPGLLYQFSQGTSDGSMGLTLTFRLGTNLNDALVEVQNRISQATPRLPDEVRRFGVSAEKAATDMVMVINLISTDGTVSPLDLANFARLRVKDEIAGLSGVGTVRVFGPGEYGMRVWLDPERLTSLGLTPDDVVRAIREQNAQVTAGAFGTQPSPSNYQLNVTTQGRLVEAEEFRRIVVASNRDGTLVHLDDVARVELGANNYGLRSRLSLKDEAGATKYLNRPAVALPVFQSPGSNALAVSESVRTRMAELQDSFPPGVAWEVVYDPTQFIQQSIDAVVTTLLEALALVVLVVIVFLQSWRAALIPLLAVPVSIIGTFAVMSALGYSINALSLFGLVLAIGIVVDDAIVVVENVERNIALGMTPRKAAVKAMQEVTGPIIAIALVLSAVFIPAAMITGLSGRFYQQFAITIAISTVISAINSLTLSPALAAVLLKDHHAPKDWLQRIIDGLGGWFFRPFNRFFAWASRGYQQTISFALRVTVLMVVIFLGLVGLTAGGFVYTPTGFIPAQDKGFVICIAQLPEGSSLERTDAVIQRLGELAMSHPAVQGGVAFPGLSIAGFTNTSHAGIVFVRLKPHAERQAMHMPADRVAGELTGMFFGNIPESFVLALNPPPVLGLGSAGGFKLYIQDKGNVGLDQLKQAVDTALGEARKRPELNPYKTFTFFSMGMPTVDLRIDRERAVASGVDVSQINATLAGFMGSVYVNDFNQFGRTWQVTAQADAAYRLNPRALERLQVRNKGGQLVPLSSFVTVTETTGPERVMHYNGYTAIDINGEAAPGFTSSQAQRAMAEVLKAHLPAGIGFEWTEVAYQEQIAGNTAAVAFVLSVVLVFLVLAALYESWALPLVVVLIVPMCLLFALAGVKFAGLDNNIMVQIGFLALIGLACKNAILIVEFAKDAEERGESTIRAALAACKLRLRPILMTSFAFIMGVIPLVIATGAGAELRRSMGVAVFSGMLGVTIIGLFLTPVFYVVIRRLSGTSHGTRRLRRIDDEHTP